MVVRAHAEDFEVGRGMHFSASECARGRGRGLRPAASLEVCKSGRCMLDRSFQTLCPTLWGSCLLRIASLSPAAVCGSLRALVVACSELVRREWLQVECWRQRGGGRLLVWRVYSERQRVVDAVGADVSREHERVRR